jgi:hypothetical protein
VSTAGRDSDRSGGEGNGEDEFRFGPIGSPADPAGGGLEEVGLSARLAAQQRQREEDEQANAQRLPPPPPLPGIRALPAVPVARPAMAEAGDTSAAGDWLGRGAEAAALIVPSAMKSAESAAWQKAGGDRGEALAEGSGSGIAERDGSGQLAAAHESSLATRTAPLSALTIAEGEADSADDSAEGAGRRCEAAGAEARAAEEPPNATTEEGASLVIESAAPSGREHAARAVWPVPVEYAAALAALEALNFDAAARVSQSTLKITRRS